MSKAPSFPLFIDAYLADTTHLSTEEHGAYLLLLMAMWRRGGSVPDDDVDNARIVNLSPRRWRQVRERLAPLLVLGEGQISQGRLKKEWDFVQRKRAAASENGALGGRPATKKNNDIAKANGFPQLKLAETSQPHTQEIAQAKACVSETVVPDPSPKSRKRTYSQAFEAFWLAYPTDALMSKKAAWDVWQRMDAEARNLAVASIPAFKAHCASDPTYRPVHANRYLSQERYVGFAELAVREVNQVFVARDTPAWIAWQKVKKTPAVRSDQFKQDGWWFPSQWPQQGVAA